VSRLRVFLLLTADALRDALRSRVGVGVLLVAVVLVLGVDRCTGAPSEGITFNGRELPASVVGTIFGPLCFLVVSFVLVAAAALVASDALARPVDDGSASLWLARPVGRATYALSRLTGGLVLVAVIALGVLGIATALLASRYGLDWRVGVAGYVTFVVDAFVVSAVAMLLSLHLPRMLTLFGVFLWLQYVGFTNGMHVVGALSEGGGRMVEGWGPPLGTALLFAVAPWAGLDLPPEQRALVAARLALWAAAAAVLLVLSFRRRDLR
jgi:hypothetical protein